MPRRAAGESAFVLGGGGVLGAAEVGMLRALLEAGIEPDLVLGSSVGAVNGAAIASEPTLDRVGRLADVWQGITTDDTFGGSLFGRLATLARSRTHIHSSEPLRRLLATELPPTFEQLVVPFQCVAASIERAGARWFDAGPLIEAILASSAVPGLLPPVEIEGEHHFDGGLVHSIPIGRAVELGARTIYVLQVGRIETPLHPPQWPWEVGLVAFEIGRRHRFVDDMSRLPEGVEVHVLPTGQDKPPRYSDPGQLRSLDTSDVSGRIERAHRASAEYLRRAGG